MNSHLFSYCRALHDNALTILDARSFHGLINLEELLVSYTLTLFLKNYCKLVYYSNQREDCGLLVPCINGGHCPKNSQVALKLSSSKVSHYNIELMCVIAIYKHHCW